MCVQADLLGRVLIGWRMQKLKVAFCTCVQLGLSCIQEIYRAGGQLDLFITLNDDKAIHKSGRIYLNETAHEHGVPLLKIDNINENIVAETIKQLQIDWLFIIGWSQIAQSKILNAPTQGCIGMHPTLLPEGRGRAAIPWAILKGLEQTGVTLFKLDEGLDTGHIIGQTVIPLTDRITATELYERVNAAHVELIGAYWGNIVSGTVCMVKQDESKATIWPGRKPEDGELDSSMTMDEAERLVRAVTHPYPGAYYRNGGKMIRIWSARTDKTQGMIPLADGFLIPMEYEVEEHGKIGV